MDRSCNGSKLISFSFAHCFACVTPQLQQSLWWTTQDGCNGDYDSHWYYCSHDHLRRHHSLFTGFLFSGEKSNTSLQFFCLRHSRHIFPHLVPTGNPISTTGMSGLQKRLTQQACKYLDMFTMLLHVIYKIAYANNVCTTLLIQILICLYNISHVKQPQSLNSVDFRLASCYNMLSWTRPYNRLCS